MNEIPYTTKYFQSRWISHLNKSYALGPLAFSGVNQDPGQRLSQAATPALEKGFQDCESCRDYTGALNPGRRHPQS